MPESEPLDPSAVQARSAAAIAKSKKLAEQVSAVASAVASTEVEAAEVHERIAARKPAKMTPEAQAAAEANADQARRFAAHEQAEHERWAPPLKS